MFIIQHQSDIYFHNKGKIILFDSQEEAQSFMSMFIQYSTNRVAQEGGGMHMIMQIPIVVMHECKIIPVDSDFSVECGTVLARELFENIRR